MAEAKTNLGMARQLQESRAFGTPGMTYESYSEIGYLVQVLMIASQALKRSV